MTVRMTRLAFGGGAEHGGDIVVAFDVGFLGEIQITAIRLRLTRKCGLQIFFGFRTFHDTTSC
jgi:xanthine dehydrogenase molybdopterin-binding subunit B